MKNEAIGIAIAQLLNNGNFSDIAVKLVNEFNRKYGAQWFCNVGTNGYVAHFQSQANTLLWFSYESTQIILFKPAIMSTSDIIIEAQQNATDFAIVESEMSVDMQNHVTVVAIIALKNLNTYKKIAKNITDTFDALFGKYWHCFVGQKEMDSFTRYISGSFISFTIRQIQFILFQTNQPKYKMNFIDVINEAKEAEVVVESLPTNTSMSNEIIGLAREALHQDFTKFYCYFEYIGGIDSAYRTCYFAISNYIYDKAISKYGGNWKVAVGELSSWECRWGINHAVFGFRFANLNFNIFYVTQS